MSKHSITYTLLIATALIVPVIVLSANKTGETQGRDLFERRCSNCHALDQEKGGPRLRGVYGRVAGSVQGFQYSEALKKAHLVWDAETLDKWLTDPEKVAPDTDMDFRVADATERSEIITYLKQLSR